MPGSQGNSIMEAPMDTMSSKGITPAGQTGAKTINAPIGCVRLGIGQSSLVVTNNQVTTNSVIILQMASNDATATVVSYTPNNGFFTINCPNAPSAEMRIDFVILN